MIARSVFRTILVALLGLVLLPTSSRAVETVSPGQLDRSDEPAPACPTFHWTADPMAAGYELSVATAATSERSVSEFQRIWTIPLPAGATGWTAAGEHCLEPGHQFAWSVRALGSELDADRRRPWAAPRRFIVPAALSREALDEALETVRRYLAVNGDLDTALPEPSAMEHAGRARTGPATLAGRSTFVAPTGVAAVKGTHGGATGETYGVYGRSDSSSGRGVVGYAASASGVTYGVYGEAESGDGVGVYGICRDPGATGCAGVLGDNTSSTGAGVAGFATSTTGSARGLWGVSAASSGAGVWARSTSASGAASGVEATAESTSGRGVWGKAAATAGTTYGIYGESASSDGRGVFAEATATSGITFGVVGRTASPAGTGVIGEAAAAGGGIGVAGHADGGLAVVGTVSNSMLSGGRAIFGQAGTALGAYAGYFDGNVTILGNLAKSGGSFQIDHPLDPENKFLFHSFVESPDMMNVYNGNVTLDENGEAWVELPAWFEALNRDFRYQLTPLGDWSACWIGQKVAGNRFLVRGGPRAEISWQVTGIRRDRWAEQHRIPVEIEKSPQERGKYLHPREWGVAEEKGIEWELTERLRRAAPVGAPRETPRESNDGLRHEN